jgi:hypothetical protein
MDDKGQVNLSAGNLRMEVQTMGKAQGFTSAFAGLRRQAAAQGHDPEPARRGGQASGAHHREDGQRQEGLGGPG